MNFDGQITTETITIPEGLNLKQVAELVEKAVWLRAKALWKLPVIQTCLVNTRFLATRLRDFCFLKRIPLPKALHPGDIVSAMVQLFFDRLEASPDQLDLSVEELKRRVVLASIVEREAKRADEMPRIAGVFFNRLDKNMRLESCATVQYILKAEGTFTIKRFTPTFTLQYYISIRACLRAPLRTLVCRP